MTVAELVLPFPSPSQNEVARWHWSKQRRLRDECRLLIRAQLRVKGIAPEAPPQARRRVDVTRHGTRLLDYGNMVGGFKPILDAMTLEGLLHDDSPEWVDDHYHQARPARGAGWTAIVITEAPDT